MTYFFRIYFFMTYFLRICFPGTCSLRVCCSEQENGKGTAGSGGRGDFEIAVLGFDDFSGQVQAEADAGLVADSR